MNWLNVREWRDGKAYGGIRGVCDNQATAGNSQVLWGQSAFREVLRPV